MPNDGGYDDLTMNDNQGWLNPEEVEIPPDLPQPLLWRVLVLPVQPQKVSRGGIVLPYQAQDAQAHLQVIGRVAAMGPLAGKSDKYRFEGSLHYGVGVGDWVMFPRYAGQRVEFKGLRLVSLNDDELLAKIAGPEGFRIHI